MLYEFLKSYKKELVSKKESLEVDLENTRTKLLESEKFLVVVKEESEEVFTEFTPRNINAKNQKIIDETEQNIIDQKKYIDDMESEVNDLNSRIKVITEATREAQALRQRTAKSVSVEKDVLMNIISYLPADPMRAKVELENLL